MLSLLIADGPASEPKSSKVGFGRIITLDLAPECTLVEVLEISGPREVANSLAQLGIRTGEKLRIKRAAPLGGAILVESGDRTVALGRAVARKVKVQDLS